jgi:nucleotide-binding universal stress UspA family protein
MAQSTLFQTVLCPIDFSDHSRQALSYAAAIVKRRAGRLIVIYVEDPLLVAAAAMAYDEKLLRERARAALRRFVEKAVRPYHLPIEAVTLDVAAGKPHQEIEWTADRLKCDLIVLGSHGETGANRLMLGSTTLRVLRRSPLPVLAIPPVKGRMKGPQPGWPGPWMLAPIDLDARARMDALAAAVSARELGAQLRLVHVVEPFAERPWIEVDARRRNQQRQRRAAARLAGLKDELSWAVTDTLVQAGKPGRAISAIATSSKVGLVVMTRRRGQGLLGPRQGSISYQVLVDARTPVLALPSDKQWLRRAAALRPRKERTQ